MRNRRNLRKLLLPGLVGLSLACSDETDPNPLPDPDIAIAIVENDTNPGVFLTGFDVVVDADRVEAIRFTIRPRPDAFAKPLSARYALDALDVEGGRIRVPVFGLYSDYVNEIDFTFELAGGRIQTLSATVATGPYTDPAELYDGPFDEIEVLTPVDDAEVPDYSYLLLENEAIQGPIVVDIDGFVRWALPDRRRLWPIAFDRHRFVIGEENGLRFLSLTGDEEEVGLRLEGFDTVDLSREISRGPRGFLVSLAVVDGDGYRSTSTLLEVDEEGEVLEIWDFDKIIGDYLTDQGDDPSTLVRPDDDWFILNSSLYSPEDNSIIVSSRQNFVLKIDYATHAIRWVFGDETKHWYVNFPSLRALSLATDDPRPIGQHSLSFVGDGLMMFNNGYPTTGLPDGLPEGRTLPSSLAMVFAIDEAAMTAEATWVYDAGLFSPLCSSIYRSGRHYLITYSSLEHEGSEWRRAIIQGVNQDREVLFELLIPASDFSVCRPWNSEIIDLEDVRFD